MKICVSKYCLSELLTSSDKQITLPVLFGQTEATVNVQRGILEMF